MDFLPYYCFFPLDLRKALHKETITAILDRGSIAVWLIGTEFSVERVVGLSKTTLSYLGDHYEAGLRNLSDSNLKGFQFARAVKDFQTKGPASRFFPWVLLESALETTWADLREKAGLIPDKQKKRLREFVAGIHEQLRTKHSAQMSKCFDRLLTALVTLHLILDVYSILGRDPNRLIDFISDMLAAEPLDPDNLAWMPDALDSILPSLSRWEEMTPEESTRVKDSLLDFVRRLSQQGGISWSTIAVFKPLLVAKPGRPPTDYSMARRLKREAGLSWAEVAKALFDSDPSLQAEFGESKYSDLSFEARYKLTERIRKGVTTYEKRQTLA